MEPAEDIRRIGGVEVRFPYKPYPSQISMMAKIIAGLKNGHNCLLESPTGSGKSLALLCSALAWQNAQQELARKEEQERSDLENAVCTCGNGDVSEVSPHFPTTPLPVAATPVLPRVQIAVRNPQAVTPNPRSLLKTTKQAATPAQILTTMAAQAKSAADDDDFKENTKRFRSPGSSQAVSRTPVQIAYETSAKPVTIKIVSKGPNGELREQTQTVLLLPHVAGQGTGVNGQPLPANPETTTARLSPVNGNAHVHPGTVHVNPVATNVHSGPTVHPNPTTATINPTSDTNGLKITTAPGLVQLVPIQTQTPVKPMQPAQGFQQPSPSAKQEYSPCIKCCQSKNFSPPPQRRKIPKIYFGTRTHKQIAQIIRELRKTYYKDVKMTILASREHTCIHPSVSQSSTKNEGCRDLLDGPGCLFNSNARKINSQSALKYMHGMDSAWDIEDLVEVCRDRKVKACPYYVSRGLRGDSDIIFCPYNYLVDPMIRKTMEINLKGEIIILDEAHNIEDSARESVSKSIEHDSIVKIIKELDDLIKKEVKMHEHQLLYDMCVRLDEFIRNSGGHLERQSFDQASTVWAGMDIVARLVGVGLGPKQFPELQRVFAAVCEEDEAEKRRDGGIPPPKLAVGSQNVLDALFTMLDFLYREELRFVEDYRVAIVRSMSFSHDVDTSGQWLNSRKKGRKQMRQVFTLNFWCLNPAVAFSDFTVVRNVVLTSGTLSPMSSFSSELGMTFPISLEANHVIKDSQVWVGSIGEGPNGGKLQATFKNTETFGFQDELGKLVLEVCKAIPHGVLCFLPSYKMLDKLSERWQTTGLWGEIIRRKKIVAEPRRGDKADFDELLRYFYSVIQGEAADSDSDDDCLDSDSVDGALFLAVCRGKVSEGLDFADNNARAVITVGIPFPNFKDIQVELKRKYNDKYTAQRGLLTGSEWYEIQAYRALNQALGRCIRHRNDWGALIMIDDRFVRQPQKYIKGLSKWVRNKAQTFGTFRQAIASLRNFTQARLKVADTENSIMSTLPTSQGENSALETPVKGNCDPATEEPLKGSNHETTLLKPVTSTPCSNHQTVELPTATPIGYGGRLSPPMSLSNKGENSSHKSMIDTSPNNDTVVSVSNMKTTGMEKSTKDGVNRFFKFCNISQPQNVHVNAEVVSKTEANSAIIKSETNTDIKQEMDISSDINDGKSSVNVNETLNEEDFLMSTPNLFDSDMSDPEAENSKENQKKEKEQEIQPAVKRPLFRRAAAKATKLLKSWIGVDDENGDENDGKAGVKSEHVRKESTDSEYDAPDLHNGTANADDDLDASLNTKRNNRNRKRKVLSRSRGANKRTKGVDFLDDFDKSGQNIQTEGCHNNNKTVTCSRCGNLLVSGVEGSEKRKRVPAFLQSVWGKRNPETVFVNKGQTSDNLKPVTSPLSSVEKGLELNSFWDDRSQCCIQYLGCAGCTADQWPHSREITKVMGAIIRLTTQDSPFTAGMMWILASDVR